MTILKTYKEKGNYFMTSSFEHDLESYAEVIVKIGLNLQPGQRLLIGASAFGINGAPFEAAPLIRHITARAYQAGARHVDVIWDDDQLQLTRFQHAPRDSFTEYPSWKTDLTASYGQAGDAIIIIFADNPDLLAGQDPDLISMTQQAAFKHSAPISKLIEKNAMNWLVIGVPVEGWAKKVLPDVPEHDRSAKMWETLFEMCRIRQADPVAGWQQHLHQLKAKSDYLTHKQYIALKYTAPGTDLSVGLPRSHVWHSGGLKSLNGIEFVANIPTEEVFTLPHKDKTEGTVRATKPLSWGGALIEGLSLTFEGGSVVKASAEKGEAVLRDLLRTDEGASRLGEVALVPHSSPISQSGLLFYNILYDENASNHLALGNAYKFSLQDGETMSDEAFSALGGNQSLIHIDFMIGSAEMNVDGVKEDGTLEPIMRQSEWV
jgi:aminopeptidase